MASENLNQSSVALTPVEATDYAENVAAYKAQKRPFLSFMSGISAGACIALAFVFYTTTQTASAGAPWGLTKFVGGFVFSFVYLVQRFYNALLYLFTLHNCSKELCLKGYSILVAC